MRTTIRLLAVVFAAVLVTCAELPEPAPAPALPPGTVEIVRDTWGVPHVFASNESDGFFALGCAMAEDRIVQMDLLRRRAYGRLAEIFGAAFVESDRKFRIAGIQRYCADAFANLPEPMQENLRALAAGVNAWTAAHPEDVKRRFEPLGITPDDWRPADCIATWIGMCEIFDRLYDENAVRMLKNPSDRKRLVDDDAAIVPESEMAKDRATYERLKKMEPVPGARLEPLEDNPLRFSHAWAVGGAKSTTGKPILESDPQTPVNNPALWYEFHLAAGRYDVRGIGVAGCPAMLVGFNRRIAWGASALGVGGTVTYLERFAGDGTICGGQTLPFQRRFERITVKDSVPVVQEVLTTDHGFVFSSLARTRPAEGEAYVSRVEKIAQKGTSVRGMLEWMCASDWEEFTDAMENYYSPGLHVVYADVDGNIGYQTLVRLPATKKTRRTAIEGWKSENEVEGRIPLREMPRMLNPDAGYIAHANNLPVGSWYPHDLGLGAGGTGHGHRSWRLNQLLSEDRKFSVDDFEALLHRDDVHPTVTALLPVARKVVEEDKVDDPAVVRILEAVKDWDGHFRSGQEAYPAAMALAQALLPAYRGGGLNDLVGGGNGGICRLARLCEGKATPKNPKVREYLVRWLRIAGGGADGRRGRRPQRRAQLRGTRPEKHAMPYMENGPLKFPKLWPDLQRVSPPLACGQVSTIWSQKGNSYTQIVDLSDVDNSRSLLPPGISEYPQSPFFCNMTDAWAAGAQHPAPLSREAVMVFEASTTPVQVVPYAAPDAPMPRTIDDPKNIRCRYLPALEPPQRRRRR
ncbi:MAG: penicillin acylase family protein [Planctomycetota bacterium]